jgi:hypothetical protein
VERGGQSRRNGIAERSMQTSAGMACPLQIWGGDLVVRICLRSLKLARRSGVWYAPLDQRSDPEAVASDLPCRARAGKGWLEVTTEGEAG